MRKELKRGVKNGMSNRPSIHPPAHPPAHQPAHPPMDGHAHTDKRKTLQDGTSKPRLKILDSATGPAAEIFPYVQGCQALQSAYRAYVSRVSVLGLKWLVGVQRSWADFKL